jgi:hypothetical protein
MGICKEITNILRKKEQDIQPYLIITEGQWKERLDHIDSLNEKWFKWDKIPGKDSQKRIDFLKYEFAIDWIKQEQIKKVDDKTIEATNETKSILLKLSDDETKVILNIDNNTTDEFKVNKEKTKLNVYYESVKNIPERDLTFIIACAFAIEGKKGCNLLLEIFCENQSPEHSKNTSSPIWFEFRPHICKDPKSGPGGKAHSTLDLALGNFNKHETSEIVYKPPESGKGWICFVEMKIMADISGNSTDNPTYNQLAKYIKSAFNFHEYCRADDKKYPEIIHVTLVTPNKFIENRHSRHSRLYGYKFGEYKNEKDKTINVSDIKSDIPNTAKNEYFDGKLCVNLWTKAEIDNRLTNLKLHWIPYEKLLFAVPADNNLKKCIDKICAANPIFEPVEFK